MDILQELEDIELSDIDTNSALDLDIPTEIVDDIDLDVLNLDIFDTDKMEKTVRGRSYIKDETDYAKLKYNKIGKVTFKIDEYFKSCLDFVKTTIPKKDGVVTILVVVIGNVMFLSSGNTIVDSLTRTVCDSIDTFYFNIAFDLLETIVSRGYEVTIDVQDKVTITRKRQNSKNEDKWVINKENQNDYQLEVLQYYSKDNYDDTIDANSLSNGLNYLYPVNKSETVDTFKTLTLSEGVMFARKPSAYFYIPLITKQPYILTPMLSKSLLYLSKINKGSRIMVATLPDRHIFQTEENTLISKRARITDIPSLKRVLTMEIENTIKVKTSELLQSIDEVTLGKPKLDVSLQYENNILKLNSNSVTHKSVMELEVPSATGLNFGFEIAGKLFDSYIKYLKTETLFIVIHKNKDYVTLVGGNKGGLRATIKVKSI